MKANDRLLHPSCIPSVKTERRVILPEKKWEAVVAENQRHMRWPVNMRKGEKKTNKEDDE